MKYLILFSILFCGNLFSAESISGKIVKGLRILEFSSKNEENNFTLYRGDYIKFKLGSNMAEGDLVISDLKVSEKVYRDLEKSKLIKMPKVGEFNYTLGKKKGKIKVIEYQEANYKLVSASEAKELIDTVSPLILDVRSEMEFSSGHIPNSKLIPVNELEERISEIEKYKNQDVFIYCASGNRSTVASRMLIDLGFRRIYNLRYGIAEWKNVGYPINR